MSERDYQRGNRAAYRAILMECARNLGDKDPLVSAASLLAERNDAINALRDLCKRFGLSNDWPDTLYLADIIEKYVERSLARKTEAKK